MIRRNALQALLNVWLSSARFFHFLKAAFFSAYQSVQ